MNAEERQALREKHTCSDCDYPNCHWCVRMDYPCDVIKVLDALDEILNLSELKTEPEIRASATSDGLLVNECDHMVYVNKGAYVLQHASVRLTYCPKCGEKL
jgi:hypothetical protein